MNRVKKEGRSRYILAKNRTGYVFLAPFLVGFTLFIFIPLIQSFIFSFNDIKIAEGGYTLQFLKWENYRHVLLVDTGYRMRIVNSFGITLRDTLVVIPFSFFSALLLHGKFKGRTAARAVFFLPVIISTGVLLGMDSQAVFQSVMNRDPSLSAGSGEASLSALKVVNAFFTDSLPPTVTEFIATAADSTYDIIIKSGIQIIIFLGGLNTIGESVYEASNIEGATVWVNFWKITFPMCGPYILLNVVYTIIDSFTNLSNPLISHIRGDLISLSNFGKATAAVWIYFLAISIVLGLTFKLISRKVYYRE